MGLVNTFGIIVLILLSIIFGGDVLGKYLYRRAFLKSIRELPFEWTDLEKGTNKTLLIFEPDQIGNYFSRLQYREYRIDLDPEDGIWFLTRRGRVLGSGNFSKTEAENFLRKILSAEI